MNTLLQSSWGVEMDSWYIPTSDLQVATKEYVDDNAWGWTTYPSNVYVSSDNVGSDYWKFTFTHNLWLIQSDVENWRYKVFLSWKFSNRGWQFWDVSVGSNNALWGDINGKIDIFHEWNSWFSPNSSTIIFHQANTTKIKLDALGSSLASFKLIIQQLY